MQGKVNWYDETKGFGFIIGDNEKSYFVHRSFINSKDTLKKDDSVTFTPTNTEKGLQAHKVGLV